MPASNQVTSAVYRWWESASLEDRQSVSVEAGYSVGWGAFKPISLNKFEIEAFARILIHRRLIEAAQ